MRQQQQELIAMLSEMCDLIGLADYIGQATDYGNTPAPAARWDLTRAFLAEYASDSRPEEVITLLEQAGAFNDMETAMWVAQNEQSIP